MDEMYEKAVKNRDNLYMKYGLTFDNIKDLSTFDAHVFKCIAENNKILMKIEAILTEFYSDSGIQVCPEDKPLSECIRESIERLIEHGFLTKDLEVTELGKKFKTFIDNEVVTVMKLKYYFPEAVKEREKERTVVVIDSEGVKLEFRKGDILITTLFSVPLDVLELYFRKNPDKLMDFIDFTNNLVKNSLQENE